MSQEPSRIWSTELEIEDPRLPKLQATKHAQHVRMALSYRQEQYSRQKAAKQAKFSSQELAAIIDANAQVLAKNVKVAFRMNARKRKALIAERTIIKRRRVNVGGEDPLG
ncbi:hypothetical protein PTTG_28978 [Puccinia triticina 1-1 BBBD Race 1]|uniref:Uncharacterized protein n=1 Tax=Puccinia triticina (isolate 1-1 / race 1 (BBBD)) TaxID=630390 RepID=A0A180G7D9_PUCT1|nr:hypothetical protein PTTG_28978 [Puccinia triticina 1-1 BBBD Race 1]